jgi:TPR repeat protein
MPIAGAFVIRRRRARAIAAVRRCLAAVVLAGLSGIGAMPSAHADALARGTAAYSRGDYIRAARELTPLAQRGNARALGLLGFLYEHGFGEPQIYSVAADLYTQGAVQGDPFSQAMLGLMYDKGHGVPLNFVLAYKWLNLAAAHASGSQRDAYVRFRDAVASKMSTNEINKAQYLILSWTPTAPAPFLPGTPGPAYLKYHPE